MTPVVFELPEKVAPPCRGGAWLIGNFDGVHKGHQALIKQAQARWGAVSVITFEPHPRQYFFPDQPFVRLTDAATKAQRLGLLGVRAILQCRFNADFAALTAPQFIAQVLQEACGVQQLAVGSGFRFGAGRLGTVSDLRAVFGADNVIELAPVVDKTGQAYSSSRIRAALTAGDTALAQQLLGWGERG